MELEEAKELGEGDKREETNLERLKSYLYSIFMAFSTAAFNIVSMVSLDKGMSQYTLVTYGYALGTITTALLAFLFERKNECKLSLPICLNIVLLGFIGIFGGILFYSGLEYTSPAFASAISNLNPSMTFVLAILCRMEKLNVTTLSGQAKIGGTIVSFGGATLMTLYKGITLLSLHSHHTPHQNATSKVLLYKNLIKGSILLLVQCLSVSSYFILQTITVRRYPAPLTLTSLTSLSGTVTATIIAAILDHKASSWKLSWDITLIAPIYSGIMFFGIASYVQALIVRKSGPVFLTAFRPLSTVIVAIIGLLTLGEALHLGGVMGATMIVFGLYAILWGKEEEKKQRLLGPIICHQEIEIKAEN